MNVTVLRTRLLTSMLFVLTLILLFVALSSRANILAQEDSTNRAVITATISEAIGMQEPTLAFVLPEPAAAGEMITVTLVVEDAIDLAGFQVELSYDAAGLKYASAAPAAAFAGSSRQVLPLGPVRKEGAVLLGAATCPVADCDAVLYEQARSGVTAAGSVIELATFSFFVRESGTHEIHLSEALLVDSSGNPLLSTPSFRRSAAQNPDPAVVDLDVTDNNVVNDSDAWVLISSWYDLQEEGQCLAAAFARYDVNDNGCIDITDVQKVLSAWGESPDPELAARLRDGATGAIITLTVDSAGDQGDANKGDGLCRTSSNTCTLRAALEEANVHPGPEIIRFDISNGSCASPVVIEPGEPFVLDAADNQAITIDGYSQCGASPNTQAVNGNARIRIEIKGTETRSEYGLTILSNNNVVKGLAIYEWHRQIYVVGARDNRFEGNFLGTNAAQTQRSAFAGPEIEGIHIRSSHNVVGGTTPAARNIVSGNNQDGVNIQGSGAQHNVVIGNYIGLKQDGVTALSNTADGVDIAEGAANNRIGGLNPGQRNVISGNGRDGVELSHGATAQSNRVVGNFIGLNAAGTGLLRNGQNGVTFEDVVNDNHVYRNVIVDNGANGVRFYTVYANQVYANFIGVYPAGIGPNEVVPHPNDVSFANLVPAPNGQVVRANNPLGQSGIFMLGGSHLNVVRSNVIAYHPEYGIYLNTQPGYLADVFEWTCETYYNTFSRNRIYNNEKNGIRLKSGECQGSTYTPNQGIEDPSIGTATTASVTGSACRNCKIELFIADKSSVNAPDGDNHGEGKIFVGEGTAGNNGRFTIPVSGVAVGQVITATATDGDGNTSEFGRNVRVTAAPPPAEEEYQLFLPLIRRN